MSHTPCALVMAGGTGGHIFPGLAVAQALRDRGWRVHWLGVPGSMEERLVPPRGFVFEPVQFAGVRGKSWKTLLSLPFRLVRAVLQSIQIMRRIQPDVVLGFGGYITVPGGLACRVLGKPLLLHEQNAVAGLSNRWLAKWAHQIFTAYPSVLPRGEWVGNPLRAEFLQQPLPEVRFRARSGPLRLLVVGGSLGAHAFNQVVPRALALLPFEERPLVTHQGGEKQLDSLRDAYAQADVQAVLTPFIRDTAQAFADADLVLARAGASTVTELAAVGVAALFVPFPHAVDDHQTHNARFLVDAGGAWLMPQTELTPESLAHWLQSVQRSELLLRAQQAYTKRQVGAVDRVVAACQHAVAAPTSV